MHLSKINYKSNDRFAIQIAKIETVNDRKKRFQIGRQTYPIAIAIISVKTTQ